MAFRRPMKPRTAGPAQRRRRFGAVCALLVFAIVHPLPVASYTLRTAESGDVIRWRESCLKYSIHEDGLAGIPPETLHDTIRAAFDAWANVSCSYFYFEETAPASCDDIGYALNSGNMNLLVFRSEGWLDEVDHNPSDIALTTTSWDDTTGRLLDADIEFNADLYEFSTDGTPHTMDLQNTATHEIGHVLGLDESNVLDATMFGQAGKEEMNKRTLEADDISAVCALYPPEEDPHRCLDPHCGLDLTCASTECSGSGVANPVTATSNCSALPTASSGRSSFTVADVLFLCIEGLFSS